MTLIINALIVDDDKEVRDLLSSILESEGYFVEISGNGKEALDMCKKYAFDVAFIDIELPDMKGTELLHILKEKQPRIIRIIITGYPSIENAVKAVNEKADGYIIKPFKAPELLGLIKKLFEERANSYLKLIGVA